MIFDSYLKCQASVSECVVLNTGMDGIFNTHVESFFRYSCQVGFGLLLFLYNCGCCLCTTPPRMGLSADPLALLS